MQIIPINKSSKGQTSATAVRPELSAFLEKAETVIIDKSPQLRLAWCCIMAGGHLLIEDEPGMGKTTTVKLIAKLLDLPWRRIQCTNDMLPADIMGGSVFDDRSKSFVFHPGPIFSNLVMADELNRASAKSQSAFLQAMEESSVTVDGTTHALPKPFVMIATQNALDSAGTNPLPESQLDRFMMRISLGLPARSSEKQLIMQPPRSELLTHMNPVISREEILRINSLVHQVYVSERVAEYILDLVTWVRERAHGLSARTTITLAACAKAWAFSENRDFLTPFDVQKVWKSVLAHRLIAKTNSNNEIVKAIVEQALVSVDNRE